MKKSEYIVTKETNKAQTSLTSKQNIPKNVISISAYFAFPLYKQLKKNLIAALFSHQDLCKCRYFVKAY